MFLYRLWIINFCFFYVATHATIQTVEISLDTIPLDQISDYGFYAKEESSGVTLQDGENIENGRIYIPFSPRSSNKKNTEKSTQTAFPYIKVLISNDAFNAVFNLHQNKKVLISPFNLKGHSTSDYSKYSYVCELHIDRGQSNGHVQYKNLSECNQFIRGKTF